MVERLKKNACVYPRIRIFDGISSEIIMDKMKTEFSSPSLAEDPTKDQVREYTTLQLLDSLSPERCMVLNDAFSAALCTHVSHKVGCIYFKEVSSKKKISESCL